MLAINDDLCDANVDQFGDGFNKLVGGLAVEPPVGRDDQDIAIDFLEEQSLLDDTLFIVVSDNGASQEGGPNGVMDVDIRKNVHALVDELVEQYDAFQDNP